MVDKFIGKYADEDDLLNLRESFDSALWGEIELDTRRTHSAFNFYQKQIEHTQIYSKRPTKNSDVLSRILYVWGKMNSTVRYVQGYLSLTQHERNSRATLLPRVPKIHALR